MPHPVLISAGATRNPIDSIRYISAFSTGRTGVAIAEALSETGPVTLLGSAEACLRTKASPTLSLQEYRSTRDLMQQMLSFIQAHPSTIVVHAAAVGDYEIADAGQGKIPSGSDELVLRFTPTPKIVDHLRAESATIRLVSFKAAAPNTSDTQLVTIASRQRERTASDLVFANVLGRLSSRVLLLGAQPTWHETRASALAGLIAALQRWQKDSPP